MSQTKTDLSSLNEQQREAVISEEKRLLVLAGAGSGKTKTLLQKLVYLIDEKNVSPTNILAITFTKNASNEMLDRLIITADETEEYLSILSDKFKTKKEKDFERIIHSRKHKWIENLTLRTFHSLCYSILRNYGVQEFDNKFKIISDTKIEEDEFSKYTAKETTIDVADKIIIELCQSTDFILDLKRYILDYIVDKVHTKKEINLNKYPEGKFYTSLNGTKVRSKSEQYIADWLFRHNVKFEYEPVVKFVDFNFKPDFYIPEANLYLEHISDKSYSTVNKEEQFVKAEKLLVKTFEKQTESTPNFNLVLDRIVKNRLPSNYHYKIALSYEEEFQGYGKDIKDFRRLVLSVLDLIKVENLSFEDVLKKSQEDQHERVRDFYKLAIPILKRFNEYCTNKSYLDFNDMIIKTISLFKNHSDIADKFKKKFEYILVDEFQDVNNLQVELIKLLLTDKNQLFCVGDDWQSIYGFRGSNVDYIVNFQNHYQNAKTIKLNLNYRSTEHIVGASNEVIKHNKVKVEKLIQSTKKSNSKIHIFAGKDEDDQLNYAVEEVRKLMDNGYSKEDILFLYRRSKMSSPFFERFKQEGLFFNGKTIHASKGLEAKAVFIIGMTEGGGGFPDIWMEDRIFQVVKASNHDILMEEERRLFYVSITRAKDELFLLTIKGNESSFLKEIPDIFTEKTSIKIKPVIDYIRLCEECNNRLNEEFKFCPYCGANQGKHTAST